jgi:uncharacterized protein (DUF302 family)
MDQSESVPAGTTATSGIVSRRSPAGVGDTVGRLTEAIEAAGAKVFLVIDQSAEARHAGLELRDTRMVVFGNPSAGTEMMQAAPLVALDLPLRVLVWADDAGAVWMTYLSPEWVTQRYGLTPEQARPLGALEALTTKAAAG